ncbi:two component, sigma54 specific, transcriptional regulator, Fis family [Desulfurobacterium thermolithotrophum DSM 11699]|uniref:Two component, sigma54 specific, transcriptional regulator, Fis family n=1 Tax=Desulfurobacterium thermolithotrophum (strain DSM 11699 / BSA) TaxID=868864 RepID=F0S3N6_DESTD|nr:sigma-54 dependent transcriptional regulator [Desulfurobacterium thermolithotrophum]ADY73458.1 two component, sigma54 specific, transcriptional regulator, Fis family [Desulfurobacterium thermolithotrophum DSM 11699]
MAKILIADDEKSIRVVLKKYLSSLGHEVIEASDGIKAIEVLNKESIDIAFVDIRMPKKTGLEILKEVKNVPIVILTAYGTMDYAIKAMENGAIEYITKPFSFEEIKSILDKVLSLQEREEEEESFCVEDEIIGTSRKMQEVFKLIGRVAKSNATILITGESGTGKELIAKAIHKYSSRRDRPFLAVNCAALPPNLLEAELFGYEKGAFTGAISSKKGIFEQANGGTIFLDEIGELELSLQSKLLRVLQEKEIRRIGGTKTIKVDVRIVTATNRNLEEEVKKGNFREDLFFRLNVVNINLPPLRERREDIIPLAVYFIKKFSKEFKLPVKELSESTVEWLLNYDFPGNVRELENMILRAMLLSPIDIIDVKDLKPTAIISKEPAFEEAIRNFVVEIFTVEQKEKNNLYDLVIKSAERILISEVLKYCNYNQVKAAKILGIHRNTLRKKIKELKIEISN